MTVLLTHCALRLGRKPYEAQIPPREKGILCCVGDVVA